MPARTRVFVWKGYTTKHLAQFMCLLLCANYRQKPEINIYYTSDMLYFFEKSSKAKFQDIYGNIMAQKPAILVRFGLCLLTKRPRLGVAIE